MFLADKSNPLKMGLHFEIKLLTQNMDLTNPLLYMAEVQLEFNLNI